MVLPPTCLDIDISLALTTTWSEYTLFAPARVIPVHYSHIFVSSFFLSSMGFGKAYELRLVEETKKRKERENAVEQAKESIVKKYATGMKEFREGQAEVVDLAFKAQTVGLVSKEEFQEKQSNFDRIRGADNAHSSEKTVGKATDEANLRKKKVATLSFDVDESEEEEEEARASLEDPRKHGIGVLPRLGKDPLVDTCFLPDRDKELQEKEMRAILEKEYIRKQEALKAEPLSVTYSYFNGSGHRRSVTVRKGDTILDFLKCVQAQLRDSFREIKSSSSSDLMYIKEDVILPHSMSFYELIMRKAQGKSGPLFRFDVQEHISAVADCRLPSMDSHPGKVVEKHWYSNNKHIHPFNKWESFDPSKHCKN